MTSTDGAAASTGVEGTGFPFPTGVAARAGAVSPATSISFIGLPPCSGAAGRGTMLDGGVGSSLDKLDRNSPALISGAVGKLTGRNPTPVSKGTLDPGDCAAGTAMRFAESAARAIMRRRIGSIGGEPSPFETAGVALLPPCKVAAGARSLGVHIVRLLPSSAALVYLAVTAPRQCITSTMLEIPRLL